MLNIQQNRAKKTLSKKPMLFRSVELDQSWYKLKLRLGFPHHLIFKETKICVKQKKYSKSSEVDNVQILKTSLISKFIKKLVISELL